MTYAQENGYTPRTFTAVMSAIRTELNNQFNTNYTEESFVGTAFYKYFYALVQELIGNETRTAEVFAKVQEYISTTNARIQRPSVSLPGIVDSFALNGYVASVKKNIVDDAGTISVCVNVDETADDYATTRLEICNFLKDFIAAALVTLGTEEEEIVLSNGQAFDFKYSLPDKTPIILRLTITVSTNTALPVPSDEVIRQTLFENINARYRLGWNFEPDRYFTQTDAPYAALIVLEYSVDDGDNWTDAIFTAAFDDLLTFALEDIAVVFT